MVRGIIGGACITALLLLTQYTVLWIHPAQTLGTIALQLSAMGSVLGLALATMKWRDMI